MVLPQSPADSQRFGRYELIARVATGGMGTVYLCRAQGEGGFNRLFTLKVLHEHLSGNADFVQSMQREARIAARLHHPNIVNIVDVGSAHEAFYLVMDYIEGCTLADLLNHHLDRRPPSVIVSVLLDALNGLHAAHELVDEDGKPLNLVHRDLSPENLLIGTDGHCRLIDFGIAKAADRIQFTRPGVVKGKPAYMSPEHVTGSHLDRRSDLFSMGVVLFNALTGKRLFDGASPHATMYNVLKRRVPPPSLVGLRPPACFDAVCLRALHRNMAERYQSAQEMAEALRNAALAGGHWGSPADVAEFVTATFGEQLEARRQKTRAFLRSQQSISSVQLTALPEITLSASSLQPTLTPTKTEQRELLTWEDLSREPDAPAQADELPEATASLPPEAPVAATVASASPSSIAQSATEGEPAFGLTAAATRSASKAPASEPATVPASTSVASSVPESAEPPGRKRRIVFASVAALVAGGLLLLGYSMGSDPNEQSAQGPRPQASTKVSSSLPQHSDEHEQAPTEGSPAGTQTPEEPEPSAPAGVHPTRAADSKRNADPKRPRHVPARAHRAHRAPVAKAPPPRRPAPKVAPEPQPKSTAVPSAAVAKPRPTSAPATPATVEQNPYLRAE